MDEQTEGKKVMHMSIITGVLKILGFRTTLKNTGRRNTAVPLHVTNPWEWEYDRPKEEDESSLTCSTRIAKF